MSTAAEIVEQAEPLLRCLPRATVVAGCLRVAMLNGLPPNYSYLLSVSSSFAVAWVVIALAVRYG